MTPDAKVLLEKLLRTRPKPDERALTELFMAIKATSIKDLLALARGGASVPRTDAATIEGKLKKRLRKVGGKAADFVPYLLDEIKQRRGDLVLAKAMPLGKALAVAIEAFGQDSNAAVDRAFKAYVAENDVSYRLKSA